MDYEKKYKAVLEQARDYYNRVQTDYARKELENIFPELRESEDEMNDRMRGRVIESLVCYRGKVYDEGDKEVALLVDEEIAWMKKQKEQKPAEWNDADMREARNNLISVCRDWERGEKTTLLPRVAVRARYFLEHLTEPKPVEWSEEDEKAYNNALDALYYKGCNDKDDLIRALEDLCHLITEKRKVIPPYARWKPTQEQMEALETAERWYSDNMGCNSALVSLCEQLKNL